MHKRAHRQNPTRIRSRSLSVSLSFSLSLALSFLPPSLPFSLGVHPASSPQDLAAAMSRIRMRIPCTAIRTSPLETWPTGVVQGALSHLHMREKAPASASSRRTLRCKPATANGSVKTSRTSWAHRRQSCPSLRRAPSVPPSLPASLRLVRLHAPCSPLPTSTCPAPHPAVRTMRSLPALPSICAAAP